MSSHLRPAILVYKSRLIAITITNVCKQPFMTRIFSKLIAVEVAAVAGAVELPRQLPNPAAINTAASLWDFSAAEEAAMLARVDCYGDSLLCEEVDGEIRCKF